MALDPRTVALDEAPNPELVDMARRFWAYLALTTPLLIAAMAEMIPGQTLSRVLPGLATPWVVFTLAMPVVFWEGWPFFARRWTSVANRSPNMFILIDLGTGATYLDSVVATLFPGLFPASMRGHDSEVPVSFEPATFITTLVHLGQVLDLRARSQTGDALKALCSGLPRRRPASSARMVPRRTPPSTGSSSETGCGSGRARRSPGR